MYQMYAYGPIVQLTLFSVCIYDIEQFLDY